MDAVTYDGSDLEVLADMPNYYSWIMETFTPHVRGHVVEYGAGVGTISARLAPLAQTLTLVEPSPNLVPRLAARFADTAQVTVTPESLETHTARLASDSIDTVVVDVLNTLMGATSFNPALVSLNDRYAVPLTRAIERAFGAPFGKNLILVARKDKS